MISSINFIPFMIFSKNPTNEMSRLFIILLLMIRHLKLEIEHKFSQKTMIILPVNTLVCFQTFFPDS
jgi:hypothetical protein